MVLSHSLSKIFFEISPPAKIGCLLDDKAREGPAQPAPPSHPPSYRLFDDKFSPPTCPTQCLLPVGNPDQARRRGQKPGWPSPGSTGPPHDPVHL